MEEAQLEGRLQDRESALAVRPVDFAAVGDVGRSFPGVTGFVGQSSRLTRFPDPADIMQGGQGATPQNLGPVAMWL